MMHKLSENAKRAYGALAPHGALIGALVILAALILTFFAFFRSEQYRESINILLSQTFEVQDRASQIRERLNSTIDDIKLSVAYGREEPDLKKNLRLLEMNLVTLQGLDYAPRFLQDQDFQALDRAVATIDEVLEKLNREDAFTTYNTVLARLSSMQEDVRRVAGTSLEHSQTLNETARIEAEASRNAALFAGAAFFVLVIVGMLLWASSLAKRQDHQSRSFASLFAHMTRSRVAGVALFVRGLSRQEAPDDELVSAAMRAVDELEAINNGILLIAGTSQRTTRKEPLSDVLIALRLAQGGSVTIEAAENTWGILVPTPHVSLVINELVQNAKHAIDAAKRTSPEIAIGARIKRSWILFRHLVLEVSDNGIGMSPETSRKAMTPFFSTRAGPHVGLGLTGCNQMVRTLRGRMKIISKPGIGTTMRIFYPLGIRPPSPRLPNLAFRPRGVGSGDTAA